VARTAAPTPGPATAARATAQPSPAASPSAEVGVPADWQTYRSETHSFAISYPPDFEVEPNGDLSTTIGNPTVQPAVVPASFIYVSAIPKGFEGSTGEIYNYDPDEARILLDMEVGESQSVSRVNSELAHFFTYTRLPDTQIAGRPAKTFAHPDLWEFPPEVKEIRYYVETDTYTYLVGGYIAETDPPAQPGFITEAQFNQIISTFRVEIRD
jgi:hypothetical protein